MNKLGIACLLLLTINVSSKKINYDNVLSVIYDKCLLLIEGMTTGNEKKCYNIFYDNKDKLFYLFKDLFNCTDINDAFNKIMADIIKYHIDIVQLLQALGTNCHLEQFLFYINDLNVEQKRIEIFKRIGLNIVKNAHQFQKGTTSFVRKRKLNDKIKLVGIVASAILDIKLD